MYSTLSVEPSITLQEIAGSRVRVCFGAGTLGQLGDIVKTLGSERAMLVTDAGIVTAGYVERAVRSLYRSGVMARVFDLVEENPTTLHVERGLRVATTFKPDMIIGLGGGSSMDCAKGVNFRFTNGGQMQDYCGVNKAHSPMLPMVAVPTTAGTGSEAQSFALITDPQTHQKMACGDHRALPKVAILDPDLTRTQPPHVAAATGIDAIAHAVESSATTKRNDISRQLSISAWNLLNGAFETAMKKPEDDTARQKMLLGAHFSGAAIENSMLGAAHSLANALTATYGTVHGVAVGLVLPHVVRFNAGAGQNPYADLLPDANALADRLGQLLDAGQLPKRLSELNVPEDSLENLAGIAARQWTATFNPRPVDRDSLRQILQSAF